MINLTGASIGEKRWSGERKREILDSRVKPTRMLAEYCAELKEQSPVLLNASAVGVYGLQPEVADGLPPALDETTKINFNESTDFLSAVGRRWEQMLQIAEQAGVRVVKMRFGVVFGPNGGALVKMKLPFLFYLGGPIGSGQQPFSWVSLFDLIHAVKFLLNHSDIKGPVNIVSPNCITQKTFAKTLGEVLEKPSILPMPGLLLKLALGQMAKELLLSGQHAKPKVLLENGFEFQYADLKKALTLALKP